jgi:hypothetical protein
VADVVVWDPCGAEVGDEVRDIPDYERQKKKLRSCRTYMR